MSRLTDELMHRQEMESQKREAEAQKASTRKTRRMNGGMIAGVCATVGAIAIGTPLLMSAFASSRDALDEPVEIAKVVEDESPETVVTVESIDEGTATQVEPQEAPVQQQAGEIAQEATPQGELVATPAQVEVATPQQDQSQLSEQVSTQPEAQVDSLPMVDEAQAGQEQDASSAEVADANAVPQQEAVTEGTPQAELQGEQLPAEPEASSSPMPESMLTGEGSTEGDTEPDLAPQSISVSGKTSVKSNNVAISPKAGSTDSPTPDNRPTPRISVVNSLSLKSLKMGTTKNVKVSHPSGTTVYYDSEDEDVFKVTLDGKIIPVSTGTARLVVHSIPNKSYSDGVAYAEVTVEKGTPKLTVKRVPTDKMPRIGQSIDLTVNTNSDGKVSYSSGRRYVATVSNKGRVNGVRSGKSTITIRTPATKNWNSAKTTIEITVRKKESPTKIMAPILSIKESYSNVQKKDVKVPSGIRVISPKGLTRYKNASPSYNKEHKFRVDSLNGKITIPKGTAKGSYTVKIEVTLPGNTTYEGQTKTVNCRIKIS